MIKTALKHWIYELCIEQFFSNITENFKNVSMKSEDIIKIKIKAGKHFDMILVNDNRWKKSCTSRFYNCNIISVSTNKVLFSSTLQRVFNDRCEEIGIDILMRKTPILENLSDILYAGTDFKDV